MPWWQWVVDSIGAVLALVLLYGVALVVRRRWISRAGGTFEFSVRVRSERAGRGWVLGLARYSGETLEWFRIFSLALRPSRALQRGDLACFGRRDVSEVEASSLYAGHVVVTCDTGSGPVEVAMSPDALTGFLAWLEASPPGRGRRPL